MGRTIVVSSNCQTGGVAAALAALLPHDHVDAVPCDGPQVDRQHLEACVRAADVWVTSASPDVQEMVLGGGRPEVVRMPRVVFDAFHPDAVRVVGPDGKGVPSPVSRMHSAIVVWGWGRGLDADDVVALFTPATMDALGYTSCWDRAVEQLRATVDATDIDFAPFFLPLLSGPPFMLTVNHPRLSVLVQLAQQVAVILGADDDRAEYPWEEILPDALLTGGPIWPLYPAVAAALGRRGGFVWRRFGGGVLGLEQFVAESLEHLGRLRRDDVAAPVLDDPRFDAALGGSLVPS
jgi:hypothetical protein